MAGRNACGRISPVDLITVRALTGIGGLIGKWWISAKSTTTAAILHYQATEIKPFSSWHARCVFRLRSVLFAPDASALLGAGGPNVVPETTQR